MKYAQGLPNGDYEYYEQQALELEKSLSTDHELDWEAIKIQAEKLVRTCPFFEIVRICFRIIDQATTHMELAAEHTKSSLRPAVGKSKHDAP